MLEHVLLIEMILVIAAGCYAAAKHYYHGRNATLLVRALACSVVASTIVLTAFGLRFVLA
jgi:hypothetical protein